VVSPIDALARVVARPLRSAPFDLKTVAIGVLFLIPIVSLMVVHVLPDSLVDGTSSYILAARRGVLLETSTVA
jgi:hypothetical protein